MNKRIPDDRVARKHTGIIEEYPPPQAFEFEDTHVPVDGPEQRAPDESFVYGGAHRLTLGPA
jgi:hypothetical protein